MEIIVENQKKHVKANLHHTGFEKLTFSQLAAFIKSAGEMAALQDELVEMLNEKKEARERIRTVLVPWCELYELPFLAHFFIVIGSFPVFFPMLAKAATSADPTQVLLDSMNEEPPDELMSDENVMSQLIEGLGKIISLARNIQAFELCGKPINYLVAKGMAGSDRDWLDAIRIDPSVTGLPAFSRRLAQATILGEKPFLRSFQRALSGPSKKPMKQIGRVRMGLWLLADAGALPLSTKDLIALFVDELGLYAPGEDPGKALRKHMLAVMKMNTTLKEEFRVVLKEVVDT
jgi:hypothetical protein